MIVIFIKILSSKSNFNIFLKKMFSDKKILKRSDSALEFLKNTLRRILGKFLNVLFKDLLTWKINGDTLNPSPQSLQSKAKNNLNNINLFTKINCQHEKKSIKIKLWLAEATWKFISTRKQCLYLFYCEEK